MNLAIFAAIFVMFYVTHGIADYWVQTDWQAQHKSKNPVALWRHVGSYTLTFAPALALLVFLVPLAPWKALVAIAAIALPHAALDNRKLITWFCERTKGWRRDNMVPWPVTSERLMERYAANGAEEAFVVATRADLDAIPLYHGGAHRYDGNQFAWVEDEQMVSSRHLRTRETDRHKNGQWSRGGWDWDGDLELMRPLNAWEIAVRFHVTIALDQKAHYLCLAAVAAWLAS